jgi:hypothetical protein
MRIRIVTEGAKSRELPWISPLKNHHFRYPTATYTKTQVSCPRYFSWPHACPMNQIQTLRAPSPSQWCADLQVKLMAALDAAWALAEKSDDPAVIARARDKARLCGQMAAEARKVVALLPPPKPEKPSHRLGAATAPLIAAAERERELETEIKPPAAQALAMQAALRKLKRR